MKKSTRIGKAKETLEIIESGSYYAGDQLVDVKKSINQSIVESILYTPKDFDDILKSVDSIIATKDYNTSILVQNNTVLEAASLLAVNGDKTGCLNFASAKNPGGGFLGGAVAQEESLALSSSLYGTLTEHFEMYEYNRGRPTLLYSDHMIWSPDVVMFRDDSGALLSDPYKMSIITSPAVNTGAIRNTRPEELEFVAATMLARIDKVLALMVYHGMDHILLGAWGCGVFRNEPKDIASYFASYLLRGNKYSRCFKSIVFAVLDKDDNGENITAFRDAFSVEQKID